MSVSECLEYILYKLCTDINIRTWMHPERKNDQLVNGDAFHFLRTSWMRWNLSITDARSLLDFVMRRIAYLRDLDELITQIKKFYSTPYSHMPISFIDAATVSFTNQRESRFGRVPGPGYRCDLCGGAHLKERCPRLLRPAARIRLEVIGIAQFRCDSCGREWRSDRCGRAELMRSCIRCRRSSYRRWFVETCSETCDRHCMRHTLTHFDCCDPLTHGTRRPNPMTHLPGHAAPDAIVDCRHNVEPMVVASHESSVAPAVVSYVSTAITALVEVAAPLPPVIQPPITHRQSHPPMYQGAAHHAVRNHRVFSSHHHHRTTPSRPTSLLTPPPPNHAQWHAANRPTLTASPDTPWFLPPYYEPTHTAPTGSSPPPAYSAAATPPPSHSRLESTRLDRAGQSERSRFASLFEEPLPATPDNSRLESSLDADDPTDRLADLLEFWDRYLAI
ncbi:hypothetical protein PRIPAC_77865 [Pristionchus pacificus]|uniref:Uncharacterized protein n=1 Tax=Pristionchus pacificus TaxID=54126 RepID=A0A2A6BVL8_PRIPA|nr:hypothetical protein PRIPAC_77865 [Pristionchus pacificus]|eukprot:PDM69866.1 hypothetical protein PRIPAC_49078 [Pristionchus pacificus]